MHIDDGEPLIDEPSLVTIAKFRSAAEAGYFADEIETRESVRAVLTSIDEFDATSGQWGTVYHLRVTAADAKWVAQNLREMVAETDGDEMDEAMMFHVARSIGQPESGGSWLPFALAAAAGSAALWAIQRGERPNPPPPRPVRLPQELIEGPGAFTPTGLQAPLMTGRLDLPSEPARNFLPAERLANLRC